MFELKVSVFTLTPYQGDLAHITQGLVPSPSIIWCNAMNLTVISIRRTASRGDRMLGSRRSGGPPADLWQVVPQFFISRWFMFM